MVCADFQAALFLPSAALVQELPPRAFERFDVSRIAENTGAHRDIEVGLTVARHRRFARWIDRLLRPGLRRESRRHRDMQDGIGPRHDGSGRPSYSLPSANRSPRWKRNSGNALLAGSMDVATSRLLRMIAATAASSESE